MLKKYLVGAVALLLSMGCAFASVEINTAQRAALDGVRGIGPKLSKAILAERGKNGEFKNWEDLENRVHGIGPKSAVKLSEAGLQVNGKSRSGALTNAEAR